MKKDLTQKYRYERCEQWIDAGISILLAVIAFKSINVSTLKAGWQWTLVVIAVVLALLYFFKCRFVAKRAVAKTELLREKKINAINRAVFESLNQLNESKVREILRFTYGSVSEWNPMSYTNNVLTYDVHEQIRAILISIKQVVIGIDPSRFNGDNVSVDLIYGYPVHKTRNGDMREPNENTGGTQEATIEKWKLISSGYISGNHRKVSPYTQNAKSFYTFLGYCGIRFENEKFAYVSLPEDPEEEKAESYCEYLRKYLLEMQVNNSGSEKQLSDDEIKEIIEGIKNDINKEKFRVYIKAAKDIEHYSEDRKWTGSIAGAVITIRNDAPEETFVKAMLTINTYGQAIHVPEKKNRFSKKKSTIDKDGMTVEDYKSLFRDNIMGTYINLLASELSQMYIRHAIRTNTICPLSGRKTGIEQEDKKMRIRIADCTGCTELHGCISADVKQDD